MAAIGFTMEAEGEALFVTTAAALMISAMATGLGCLVIGRFRLANLLRFIPYPVAGGFVAGIGAAVCLAALSLMGAEPDWRSIPALLEPSVAWKWGSGAAYGIGLYVAIRRWGNPLILPVSVVLVVGACHLALAQLGIPADEARASGLLLTSTTDGNLWPSVGPADLARVEWTAMAAQSPHMLTLVAVAFLCVVMNLAGLELAANQELDWDREFKVTGAASLAAGLGGGTVATLVVPASLRSKLFGATTTPHRRGRRPRHRQRRGPGRRHAGTRPGPARGRHPGLRRPRHARRGSAQEPAPAAPGRSTASSS